MGVGTDNWFSNENPNEAARAIMDIENRKRAISQASANEQNALKSIISKLYGDIGEKTYKLYAEGNFELEKIMDLLEVVQEHFKKLDEKSAKLAEIMNRYDEELEILRPAAGTIIANYDEEPELPNPAPPPVQTHYDEKPKTPPPAPAASGQGQCGNCGTAYSDGMLFCIKCGNKLSAG